MDMPGINFHAGKEGGHRCQTEGPNKPPTESERLAE
jgi:hypothetical protein